MGDKRNEDVSPSSKENAYPLLTDVVALVVLVFEHTNRVVSAITGSQISTTMFVIPRKLAQGMESESVMGVMNEMMAPFISGSIKNPPTDVITKTIFEERESSA